MKLFRYVFYGYIDIVLSGHMHIGGEEEERFSMAVDGDGDYIIPAGTIAGVLRHGPEGGETSCAKLFGDQDAESRLWFYDAMLQETKVEKRMGVCIDHEMGTVVPKKLYSRFYIGDGAKARLRIQGFAASEREKEEILEAVQEAASGIHGGVITFGSKRSTGGGTFKVTEAKYSILDLQNVEELNQYLTGVENCFASCKSKLEFSDKYSTKGTLFTLTANVPSGILVASGEKSETSDKVNLTRQIQGKDVPIVPGTTMKGMLRAHAEKVCKELGIDDTILTDLFGGEKEKKHYAGCLKTEDADFHRPQKLVYNRIQIDRWLGGTIQSKKMNAELVGNDTLVFRIWLSELPETARTNLAKALVFLALRDLGTGLVSIGSGDAIGWGRLEGKKLRINDKECEFYQEAGSGQILLRAEKEMEEEVLTWLKELGVKEIAHE